MIYLFNFSCGGISLNRQWKAADADVQNWWAMLDFESSLLQLFDKLLCSCKRLDKCPLLWRDQFKWLQVFSSCNGLALIDALYYSLITLYKNTSCFFYTYLIREVVKQTGIGSLIQIDNQQTCFLFSMVRSLMILKLQTVGGRKWQQLNVHQLNWNHGQARPSFEA